MNFYKRNCGLLTSDYFCTEKKNKKNKIRVLRGESCIKSLQGGRKKTRTHDSFVFLSFYSKEALEER